MGQGHQDDVAELWAPVGGSASRKWLGWQKDAGLQIGGCIEVTAKTRGAGEAGWSLGRPQPPGTAPRLQVRVAQRLDSPVFLGQQQADTSRNMPVPRAAGREGGERDKEEQEGRRGQGRGGAPA